MSYKYFKRHKIKNHSDMFQILCNPSSGSLELYLTEIHSGSLMFVMCLIGVWQCNFWTSGVCVYSTTVWVVLSPSYRTRTPLVQNYAAQHWSSTWQTSVNHYKFQSSTVLYSLMMVCIWSETCRSDF